MFIGYVVSQLNCLEEPHVAFRIFIQDGQRYEYENLQFLDNGAMQE